MAAASFSTIYVNSFNDTIFSAINRIRHILKQHADINRVDERKKVMNLKTFLKKTYRTI